jgi:hypothetical protein
MPLKHSSAKKAQRVPREVAMRPPPILSDPIYRRKFRFAKVSGANCNFRRGGLLTMMMSQTSGTAGNFLFDAVRLLKIEVWDNNNGLLPWNNTVVRFGGISGPGSEIVATCSSEFPCHIVAVPPSTSSAALWSQTQASGTTAGTSILGELLFVVKAATAAIIDLTVEFVMADGSNTPTVTGASGMTTGIYVMDPTCFNVPGGVGIAPTFQSANLLVAEGNATQAYGAAATYTGFDAA